MSLSTHPEVCILAQVLFNPNKLPGKIDSRMQCLHWKSWCPFCVSTHFYYWSLAVLTTDTWISTKGNHGLLSASFLPQATYAVRILTVVKGRSHAEIPDELMNMCSQSFVLWTRKCTWIFVFWVSLFAAQSITSLFPLNRHNTSHFFLPERPNMLI